ncbi:MAG: hypothetical protein ACPG5B_01820 [Chitinophagales bacterium]
MAKVWLSYENVRAAHPFRQAISVFALASTSIIITHLVQLNSEIEWFIAITALGFFVWVNAVLSFFIRKNALRYYLYSIVSFAALFVALAALAHSLSSINIFAKREYFIMLTAILVFYFLALMIVSLIRHIAKMFGIEY